MGFTAEIQQTLGNLQNNPDSPTLLPRHIPTVIISDLRDYILREIRQGKQKFTSEIDDLLSLYPWTDNFAKRLQFIYEDYLGIGLGPGDDLKVLLLYSLGQDYWDLEKVELTPRQENLYSLANAGIFRVSQYHEVHYSLEYALQNRLCYHRGDRWILTSLGEILLRLSELEGTRFLLALETFFYSKKDEHSYHIPRGVIESLLETGSITLTSQTRNDFEFDRAKRLEEFQLVWEIDGNQSVFEINPLGRLILESVLAQDSIYDTLIPIYIREIIVGSEPSRFSSAADFQRLQNLIENSPLVGELRQEILGEILRLQQTASAYLSVFTVLAPKVEGLLRNLCKIEQIEPQKSGLHGFIEVLRNHSPEILKPSTLSVLDGIIRSYRNVVEHGNSIPEEPARLACQILLMGIELVHQDYDHYKSM